MHPLLLVTILMSLIPLQLLISQWYTTDKEDQARSLNQYQEAAESISSQLINAAYFMKDVQNWKYLVMAPKRRDYGSSARKGKKEDKLWDLFRDGGTKELQNSAAQIISKLLLGDEFNDDSKDYRVAVDDDDTVDNDGQQSASSVDMDYFARSHDPRHPRPANVRYRVGQVIQHKIHGYRGIIIGWDPICKAPERWIKQNHPSNKPEWRRRPNYAVLVDIRDRPDSQTTYVAEDNILLIESIEVIHPDVDDFFEEFEDNDEYVPLDWLRKIYPDD